MSIPTKLFSYNSEHAVFYTDASDLKAAGYNVNPDDGFRLRSTRTGAVLDMIIESVHTDNEGDIVFWRYIPKPPINPTFQFKVEIFND